MKQPPLRFFEIISSLLALLALGIVIAIIVVLQIPTPAQNGTGSSQTVQASAAPAYDEQKAVAAGLQPSPAGKQLFNNNCKQCHAVDAVVVGPALANVTNRRSKEWLHSFIKNSSKVIQGGDPVAKELYEKFNKTQMPAFNFSDEEIDAILEHIKFETAAYGIQ